MTAVEDGRVGAPGGNVAKRIGPDDEKRRGQIDATRLEPVERLGRVRRAIHVHFDIRHQQMIRPLHGKARHREAMCG